MAKLAENWHPAGTKRLHLGPGPYSTLDEIKWTCRYLLLEAVLKVKPDVVAELFRTEVVAELAAVGVVAERFLTDPVKWCRAHGFIRRGEVCAWAVNAARVAQGLKQHAPAGLPVWPVVSRSGSRRDAFPVSAPVVRIDWDPFSDETEHDAYQRTCAAVKRELEITAELARQAGRTRTPIKHRPEHFEWTVRFQCCGESIPSIAGGLEERTVHLAIKDVLKRVGIDRRIAPAGRPKNTKTRRQKRLKVPS